MDSGLKGVEDGGVGGGQRLENFTLPKPKVDFSHLKCILTLLIVEKGL